MHLNETVEQRLLGASPDLEERQRPQIGQATSQGSPVGLDRQRFGT
jgi:hypothetical protein